MIRYEVMVENTIEELEAAVNTAIVSAVKSCTPIGGIVTLGYATDGSPILAQAVLYEV